ncbi:hypothetical protein ACH0B5_15720 [Ureibacillus sp. 179-F W5.1 NHS]|uniref:YhfM-like domain-containing protein n=1 Tax=Lysinibacillus halotolerans TaxID=1368476 RepID=A0A3M8H1V4_9BACI|nr:hypothetical protein [Lysinibacillus halotolerans]RNC96239.1 hypothetical protein EC501_17120 [Lysinibacillus halotolerans]
MKKLFIFFAIISFALFGCSQEPETKTSESVTEKNVEEEAYVNTKTIHLELKESEEIAIFEKAVSNSTKESGIVNMATEPQYQFNSGKESYFLWITEESGTIMNRKDTHTIYILSSNSIKEVYKFVNSG